MYVAVAKNNKMKPNKEKKNWMKEKKMSTDKTERKHIKLWQVQHVLI